MTHKSKLIILEGMECSGKSTQINFLKEYFQASNQDFI